MFKKITEDKFLNNLSEQFSVLGHTLYVVGGRLRDILASGKDTNPDTDICGGLDFLAVKQVMESLGAKVCVKNKKLHTLSCFINDASYEYAQFRTEEYGAKNAHNPSSVHFNCDIKDDYKRRDFSVNALYYCVQDKKIEDFCSGKTDIKNKIIRTIIDPEQSFKKDPARILRLIHLAVKLNFRVEENTFLAAKKLAPTIKKLTTDRLKKECDRINGAIKGNEEKERLNKILLKLNLDYIKEQYFA